MFVYVLRLKLNLFYWKIALISEFHYMQNGALIVIFYKKYWLKNDEESAKKNYFYSYIKKVLFWTIIHQRFHPQGQS